MENDFTQTYGCLLPKTDIRDYKLCSANNPNVIYPSKFTLDDLPHVKMQGQINSCCSHATSSILEYHAHNRFTLSTNFIYGIQKMMFGRYQMGMYLRDAMEIVKKYGDFLEEDCKGNTEVPNCYSIAESALKDDEAVKTAYKFRIDSYYLCSSDNDIKTALMNYGPVLCGMMWYNSYSLDKDNIIQFNINSTCGGHAVVCVGWDDEKQAWLIQNSWSESFGDHGRFWLPYNYGFFEARAVVDHPNDEDLTLAQPNKKMPKLIAKIINFFINLFK